MLSQGDIVVWTKRNGKRFRVTFEHQDTRDFATIYYNVATGRRNTKQVHISSLSTVARAASTTSQSPKTVFETGKKVYWEKRPGKTFKVMFILLDKKTQKATIQYKIRGGRDVEKKVPISQITPIHSEQQTQEQKTPEQTHTPKNGPVAMIQTERPDKFGSPAVLFFKQGGGFGRDIFNSKLLQVLSNFWTKRVPGDGWCLLHSANLLVDFYNLDIQRQTKKDLKRLANKYQPDFEDAWTYDTKTETIVKNILLNELKNPSNLSENWAAFLAKEMKCRFIIFGIQSRIDPAVTRDPSQKRKAKPKMDVWSFTAREVLPYPDSQIYDKTLYLYNDGHYWPLIPNKQVDPRRLIQLWGNKTYEKAVQ